MKGFKQFGTGLLAVLGIMLVALPASGASAAKLLKLTNGGVAVPNGAAADTGLAVEGCVSFNSGTMAINGAAKDKLTATSNAVQECFEEGVSETGTITETQLGGSGKAMLKGTIELSKPGPCVYKFTKFKGTFEVPGEVFVTGFSTGKLNKKASSETCEKTLTAFFQGDATSEPFGERFGDEL